jgi:hypothetical protein
MANGEWRVAGGGRCLIPHDFDRPLLRFRPVRPAPPARGATPGKPPNENGRPVRAALNRAPPTPLLRFRPVRPVPSARGATPGKPPPRKWTPCKGSSQMSPANAHRKRPDGDTGTQQSDGASHVVAVCAENRGNNHESHPNPTAALHTELTPNTQRSAESCPYRAKVPRGVLTWHFMPGWWNWPYRPQTQNHTPPAHATPPATPTAPQPALTPHTQGSAESCPYRAKVSRGVLTWHFMPG